MDRLWLVITGHNPVTDELTVREVSEQEIYDTYWPGWLADKVAQYGQQWVDENITFENCLQEWVVNNEGWQLR
jgi:hypothetical protein